MTWVRIEDQMPDHPKVVGLSDAAFRLHIRGMCYTARHKKNGGVPKAALRVLRGSGRLAAELVAAGVWEDGDDAWTIHDYLDYNLSTEDYQEMAVRGKKGAESRWGRRRKGGQ